MMIEVMAAYFLFLLSFQPFEELHNCNNPNLIGIVPHYVCTWEKEDFIKLKNGQKVLRPKRKTDSKIKAYYRKKYWNKIKGDTNGRYDYHIPKIK